MIQENSPACNLPPFLGAKKKSVAASPLRVRYVLAERPKLISQPRLHLVSLPANPLATPRKEKTKPLYGHNTFAMAAPTQAQQKPLDQAKLKAFENAAAGHDGVLSDESGELIIKPCTDAEVAFYQESMNEHPKFYELMPTFMGTLTLGAPAAVPDVTAPHEPEITQEQKDKGLLHGKPLNTQTAIVLENLEAGFKKPNVLDLKLGALLYDPEKTKPEKGERLDKVARETTSGSLNFRIAGMRVWNGKDFDTYDKFYGRQFNKDNVKDGFATFFSGLSTGVSKEDARQLLETILAEITKARHSLERSESRMYSASILIVYEGDADTLDTLMTNPPKTPRVDERAPTSYELKKRAEEEDEDEEERPTTHRVKMIDFAHAAWTTGKGPDTNVIKGLKNIEDQMDVLIARFEE
ncbi:Kinase [Cercospora zeina]